MFSTIGKIYRVITANTNFKINFASEKAVLRNRIHSEGIKCFSTAATAQNEDPNNNTVDVDLIVGNDPELKHKLQVLMLETEVMRQEGRAIPAASFLTTNHWKELLKLESRTGRLKFLQFLFKIEKKKENEQVKKQKKKIEREEYLRSRPEIDDSHLVYGLGHNNIFLRFYETTMNHGYNHKLIQAMLFGQKLVIDCGFDKNMVTRENVNCAKQLMLLFGDNRIDNDPFDLHFCNVNRKGQLMQALHKNISTLYEPSYPLHLHSSSYTSLFPKEKLVYLTPHARDVLTEYDHDAIYIIGALVDKINNEPLTLAKAKKEGIKMQKFPLDKYLCWGAGSGKSLTLNQVLSILLDLKRTNDWKYSLRHVPKRKLFSTNDNHSVISPFRYQRKDQRYSKHSDRQRKQTRQFKSLFNE